MAPLNKRWVHACRKIFPPPPVGPVTFASTVRHQFGRVGRGAVRVFDRCRPFVRTCRYAGYRLYYSRGTSLVERIRREHTYEEEVCQNLIRCLRQRSARAFADVGANIGLISLRLACELPELRIHAFEPGPHQHDLFARTIAANRLAGRIGLHAIALAEAGGMRRFAVHSSEHVSGDGFFDTGRGGAAVQVNVTCDTFDHWWQTAGEPKIEVMKIDTEGAELLVLRGAECFLARHRPVLFLEIWPPNLSVYPYRAEDIHDYLRALRYRVTTQAGVELTPENRSKIFATDGDYIAYPETSP